MQVAKQELNGKDIAIDYPELRNKKLFVRIWSSVGKSAMPRVLGIKKIKYGSPDFSMRVGGKERYFKVNYVTVGLIKLEKGRLYYDIVFNNSTGALSFYEFPEDMDSEEAFTTFKNNAVNMYVKKGGIPQWYLLIAFAITGACVIALLVIVPPAFAKDEQVKQLDLQATALKQRIVVLEQENNQLRSNIQ